MVPLTEIVARVDLLLVATMIGEDLHRRTAGDSHNGARTETGVACRLPATATAYLHLQQICLDALTCLQVVAHLLHHRHQLEALAGVATSIHTSQATAKTTATVAAEAVEKAHIATQTQHRRRDPSGTSRHEEATETGTLRPRAATHTVSETMIDLDAHVAGAPNTTTSGERGCRIARGTFTDGERIIL